ncbi:MAG: hypothetical protein ACRCTZ_14975 [Sarcina sp.]
MKIHLTIHKDNKLEGIVSINTSTFYNPFCNSIGCRKTKRKDREKDKICHFCYAEKNELIYKNLELALIKNSEILSKEKIEPFFINAAFVRIHSFGELINEQHMENIYNLAKFNKHATFCLMTKRYNIAMKYPKLKNVVYIASSPVLNKPIENEKVLSYFDKTFTVYEPDFDIEKIGKKINCHGLSCKDCKKCYTRRGSKEINELLRK